MRRLYIQISDEWLRRLATLAKTERRDTRVQAVCILEMGIAQLEIEHGLVKEHQLPRFIDKTSNRCTCTHPRNSDASDHVLADPAGIAR